jgi:hypothetical protein
MRMVRGLPIPGVQLVFVHFKTNVGYCGSLAGSTRLIVVDVPIARSGSYDLADMQIHYSTGAPV